MGATRRWPAAAACVPDRPAPGIPAQGLRVLTRALLWLHHRRGVRLGRRGGDLVRSHDTAPAGVRGVSQLKLRHRAATPNLATEPSLARGCGGNPITLRDDRLGRL